LEEMIPRHQNRGSHDFSAMMVQSSDIPLNAIDKRMLM
jgi:hypothetical protein